MAGEQTLIVDRKHVQALFDLVVANYPGAERHESVRAVAAILDVILVEPPATVPEAAPRSSRSR